jgi:Xaa-Pro aminopeptidase
MNYRRRQKQLVESLAQHKVDALLVTHPPNVRYLCGFTGSAAALLVGSVGQLFFTDGRYTQQAKEEVKGARVVITRTTPVTAAAQWLQKHAARQVLGIEAEHVSMAIRAGLVRSVPRGTKLRGVSNIVERLRVIKDADEIDRIRAAVMLASRLFDDVVKVVRPGVYESDVAAELEYAARKAGAEEMSFPTIVAAGTRSALPHGRASRHRIPQRGFVVFDFGVILGGYCSDMTRTLYVGRPSEQARRMYDAVRQAQQAGVEAVRAGVSAGEVDRAARSVLRRGGWSRYFTHSTGHGVGLEIHEAPRLAAGQRELLSAGMVVTVEPGAYVPEQGGVRIEDMVVVGAQGPEVLTPTSKDLIAI